MSTRGEVRLAVVREQQLGRHSRSGGAHGTLDRVERGRFVARHLERARQSALELASPGLGRHHAALSSLLEPDLEPAALHHRAEHRDERAADEHGGDRVPEGGDEHRTAC